MALIAWPLRPQPDVGELAGVEGVCSKEGFGQALEPASLVPLAVRPGGKLGEDVLEGFSWHRSFTCALCTVLGAQAPEVV